jgi:hypothetical protein
VAGVVNAYAPHHAIDLGGTLLILAATLILGYVIARSRPGVLARASAWALVIAAVAGVEELNAGEPAGFRMLAIIGALLFGMKAVVAVEARAEGMRPLSPGRWLGFAGLWPGMRPGPFARAGEGPMKDGPALMARGLRNATAGVGLVLLARGAWGLSGSHLPATALALPGLSLMIHFGAFNILAGAWRLAGVDCRPLFRDPLRATSLADFWGKRWNLAFSEMTAQAVYRPLVKRAGKAPALMASFVGSGVLHELAISVPVKAGYGLPMAYFVLHGLLVLGEGRRAQAGRAGWRGRAWTLGWLLVPMPVLFHEPFLAGVVWPLIGVR